MTSNSSIKAIELNIEQHKKISNYGKAVERLKANKDFKQIVIDGYFSQEAIRLVHLKGDPGMQSADSQLSIVKQMDAVSAFSQYLNVLVIQGNMADKAIGYDEDMREEILAEGSD